MSLLSFFGQKRMSAKEFEICALSLVVKHVTGKENVQEELRAVQNLPVLTESDEKREALTAHWYLRLEQYISQEQPRGRVPAETLREEVARSCHPEKAEGGFALLFVNSSLRQMRLTEKFADNLLAEVVKSAGKEPFIAAFAFASRDVERSRFFGEGSFLWKALEGTVAALPLANQLGAVRIFAKGGLGAFLEHLAELIGDARAEYICKETYRNFREQLKFLDDAPQVLLVLPDDFLQEERIELLEKNELEAELKRKSQALESTTAELQSEKGKLKSLSREELEERVQERTAELVSALADINKGQAELAAAKAQDETFLESIGEGLVAIDREWNVILWNKAATAFSGWKKDEVFGKPLHAFVKFINERSRRENIAFIEEAMLHGEARVSDKDTVLVAKSGNDVAVNVTVSPVWDGNKKVTGAIIAFRDVSADRELEKTREEFASLATHELRSPLAAIKGFTELLYGGTVGAPSEKQKDILGKVLHSTERMITLVNALLNVSRIELGTIAIEPEPAYLPDIADKVIGELSSLAQEKNLELTKAYDTIPSINADPKLTQAIFQNLLGNAIKYTPAGGKVNFAIKKQDRDILIEVADTGYGIPKAQQGKIFSKLFRADNVRDKEGIEGTGLGLYIVKSIVEQAGGKIWFESKENKGTTFSVSIPLEGMKKKEGLKGLS